ncbi:MAG TPA: ABC transporter permease [Dongiaceae bacterium]|nr:ABC transporter permease [Dongiaceae bacterium]
MSEASVLQVRRFGRINWIGCWSLLRRQFKNGFSDLHYTILGPVISNALYLLLFVIASSSLTTLDPEAIVTFIAPGLISFAIAERAFETSGANLIFDKHHSTHFDWVMAPLTPTEKAACFALSSTIGGVTVGAAVALMTLLFVPAKIAHPGALLFFTLATGMMHGLIGTLLGIWAAKWDQYTALHTFVLLPLAFLSGVFAPVASMPETAQTLIAFNPIFYLIDGFRYGAIGEAAADLRLSVGVALAVNAGLFVWVHYWLRTGYRLKS